MDWIILFWLAAGLTLLVGGAEILVRGASRLAVSVGISPLVVGLTVVAFGTSAPELAVSLQAAFNGSADLAVGNVVGSNIANVLLILGLSALAAPLIVNQRLVRLDVPLMIGVSLLTLFFAADGTLGRVEGVLLVLGAVAYTTFAVLQSRTESAAIAAEYEQEFGGASGAPGQAAATVRPAWLTGLYDAALVALGLVLLVIGARWLVEGATAIARYFAVADLVIGLTIVAVGTSLPELATSVVASVRGERDIAVGNVVGSNLFNLLFVLGSSALVLPLSVDPQIVRFDFPVMIATAIACLPVFFADYRIARWKGGLFLAYYILYVAYLVAAAAGAREWISLQNSLLVFLVPLTVISLALSVYRSRRKTGAQ